MSRKNLARVMAAVFFASLVPLVLVALYNYPADDDFRFTLPAARAWVETGSLAAVWKANWQHTAEMYATWQGDFFSTLLFGLNPLVFDIRLYFLSNWAMLALLCLCTGYLVKGAARALGADRTAFWIVYPAVMVLVLQFMPSIAYSIYWHNGGQYTTAACMLYLAVGLVIRLSLPQTGLRRTLRTLWLCLCCFALGGSFFGPALGAFVLVLLLTVTAWVKKNRARVPLAMATLCVAIALIISILAPGNALRQERTGETAGVLATLVTSVLDSFDLCGAWLSPQLLGMLLLIVPVMWKPLKESAYAFRQPLWVVVMLYGLFSASLAPGIYTGYGYNTARYENAIYLYFLLWAIGSALYCEGAFIRYLERAQSESAGHLLSAAGELGKRFAALYLAIAVALTALGGFAFTIMNTSSAGALKSLVNGEARTFHEEMLERQEYVRVTDSDVVAVKPLSVAPYVFKNDRLPWQGIYGCVRYMKWYFELFYNAAQGG